MIEQDTKKSTKDYKDSKPDHGYKYEKVFSKVNQDSICCLHVYLFVVLLLHNILLEANIITFRLISLIEQDTKKSTKDYKDYKSDYSYKYDKVISQSIARIIMLLLFCVNIIYLLKICTIHIQSTILFEQDMKKSSKESKDSKYDKGFDKVTYHILS